MTTNLIMKNCTDILRDFTELDRFYSAFLSYCENVVFPILRANDGKVVNASLFTKINGCKDGETEMREGYNHPVWIRSRHAFRINYYHPYYGCPPVNLRRASKGDSWLIELAFYSVDSALHFSDGNPEPNLAFDAVISEDRRLNAAATITEIYKLLQRLSERVEKVRDANDHYEEYAQLARDMVAQIAAYNDKRNALICKNIY